MYLFTEVIFYAGQRKTLPKDGYRPDAIFDQNKAYWGISFLALPVEAFDTATPAFVKFSVQEAHYQEVRPGQTFAIMEGSRQVGEGKIITIEKGNADEVLPFCREKGVRR